MEVVTGALPSVITKLAGLAAGEYNLQKGLKGEIKFLQEELESMKAALEDISRTPAEQLPNNDKIWSRNVRELSYDIEDSIDTFMVDCDGKRLGNQHGLKKVIYWSLNLLMQPKVRHNIAKKVREIKSRVVEVHERRRRYEVNLGVDKPVTVDPRLFTQYTEMKELVGIEEARDEFINNFLTQGNNLPMKQGKIVSIVGFGGLGKTTLANAVYEKIRAQFDCCDFVSVSQTPDLKRLFKGLLNDFGKSINEEILDESRLIKELREFLQDKRYFVVVDDIWDISVWKRIRCALPDNNVGYTIITTTRIADVAEQAGGPYKLKPLSSNNSRKLFFRRIFGNKNKDNNEEIEKCPDDELAEVSDRILKKCAGVPLAIITMASLLACKARNKLEWYEVYKSVGTGMENNMDVENMRNILSFSYYELPGHLRTCLLYLSMFPEDSEIDKERLIRMWIAEGFIQWEKQGKSPFEIGEFYFNELINRSMIQPIQDQYGMLNSCRIHDMVLDLIRSLSSEENFVTVLSGMDSTSPSDTIRRLSLQNGKKSDIIAQATRNLLQRARSVVIFPAAVAQVPAAGSCRFLRVLDLEHCNLSHTDSLKYLGNLYQLRYLRLYSDDSTINIIEELGQLTELRLLRIQLDEWSDKLLGCLHKLQKIQELHIEVHLGPHNIGGLDAWVAPRHLRLLYAEGICWFSTLPAWVNPSFVPVLTCLRIAVRELHQVDLDILGRLPALRHLWLMVDNKNLGILQGLIVSPGSFPCLEFCYFMEFVWPVVFQKGAMPRLAWLVLWRLFYEREARGIGSSDGGLDLGLGNLPSLQDVRAELLCEGASEEEARQAKAALTHAAKMHPNHPYHDIRIDAQIRMVDLGRIYVY